MTCQLVSENSLEFSILESKLELLILLQAVAVPQFWICASFKKKIFLQLHFSFGRSPSLSQAAPVLILFAHPSKQQLPWKSQEIFGLLRTQLLMLLEFPLPLLFPLGIQVLDPADGGGMEKETPQKPKG